MQHLGIDAQVTRDPALIAAADRVVFPGVGAAGSCMASLRALGLDAALHRVVSDGRRLIGICVGMQLLFEHSAEDGGVACLGLLPGTVERMVPTDATLKIPHMGWNPTRIHEPAWQSGIGESGHFYFVHSYRCLPAAGVTVAAESEHGMPVCAGVRQGSISAVQFHPEKSGPDGLRLLANLLR